MLLDVILATFTTVTGKGWWSPITQSLRRDHECRLASYLPRLSHEKVHLQGRRGEPGTPTVYLFPKSWKNSKLLHTLVTQSRLIVVATRWQSVKVQNFLVYVMPFLMV